MLEGNCVFVKLFETLIPARLEPRHNPQSLNWALVTYNNKVSDSHPEICQCLPNSPIKQDPLTLRLLCTALPASFWHPGLLLTFTSIPQIQGQETPQEQDSALEVWLLEFMEILGPIYCLPPRELKISPLRHQAARFFCNGPDRKYFQLCSLYDLCWDHWTLF